MFRLEPEVFYVAGSRFRNTSFIPNIVWHIGNPDQSVTFFLIGGVGFVRQHDNAIDYVADGMTFSVGAGIEFSLSDRISMAPDVRFGSDGFPRVTLGIVYRLREVP